MKTHALPHALVALAAATLIAGCNSQPQPQVVDANPDPMATVLANAAPIELPPAITADKTLRCKDNSLVYVTFFEGEKQVSVRTSPTGAITKLTAPAAGEPLTAEGGWKLTGSPSLVTLTTPTKPAQTCKA
jgi:hypothetical protein